MRKRQIPITFLRRSTSLQPRTLRICRHKRPFKWTRSLWFTSASFSSCGKSVGKGVYLLQPRSVQQGCQRLPPAHNPTCKYYLSANGCEHGDKFLSPHVEKCGLMAVRAPLTKRETPAEKKKSSEALLPNAKAKAKAKAKIKAKAKSTKAKAGVPPTKEVSDDEGGSDRSQTC